MTAAVAGFSRARRRRGTDRPLVDRALPRPATRQVESIRLSLVKLNRAESYPQRIFVTKLKVSPLATST
ncbi:hypothetical protein, partial [Nocardia altamirensis]|uniref:hypothetical protein n=1 Tax=Nocardia altamirensis TaxID=472158 RepID=UPI001C3FE01B